VCSLLSIQARNTSSGLAGRSVETLIVSNIHYLHKKS
jgi:hypothetical protein